MPNEFKKIRDDLISFDKPSDLNNYWRSFETQETFKFLNAHERKTINKIKDCVSDSLNYGKVNIIDGRIKKMKGYF